MPNIGGTLNAGRSDDNVADGDAFRAGLSGGYAIDIWGANQARANSAEEALRSQRYSQTLTGLTIARQVAQTLFHPSCACANVSPSPARILELSRRLLAISRRPSSRPASSSIWT